LKIHYTQKMQAAGYLTNNINHATKNQLKLARKIGTIWRFPSVILLISSKQRFSVLNAWANTFRIKFSSLDFSQDSLGTLQESLFHIFARFCTRFAKHEVVFLCKPDREQMKHFIVPETTLAYRLASMKVTSRSSSKSFLFPTSKMTMAGLAKVLASVSQLDNALKLSREVMS